MKRILLIAGAAFAVHGAFAAEAAPVTNPSASAEVAARADAKAANAPATASSGSAKTEEARRQLAELREQMQELSRKMAALSHEIGESGPRAYAYRYIGNPDSAMIGVVLGMNDGHVTVGAMTPDGPAARAGLRGSDIIVAINHQPIEAGSVSESLEKARKLLGNLKEGQNVTIEYLRDGKKGVVTFPAERREAWNWPLLLNDDPEHPFLPKDFNERTRVDAARATREAMRDIDYGKVQADAARAARDAVHGMRMKMPWWGLNLAPLNPDLGRYFGAGKGVLVLAADEESLPGIRAGDVITRVAGTAVSRPEDVMRALRDQESGKDVPIELLREKKMLALSMKAPEFKSIFDFRMVPPVPPVPPVLPAPAAPPPAPSATLPAPPAPPVPPDRDDT